MKILLAKKIMPTNLDTSGLRELDASLLNQSLFSAKTTNSYLLQFYKDNIAGILNPVPANGESTTQFNPSYITQGVQDLLVQVGYAPLPEDAGTLKDLSSNARINLVLKTNVEMVQSQGWWLQGQQEAILDQFPAQELFRAEGRKEPREWLQRFRRAGEATGDAMGNGWTITSDGRMIALKNHAIWKLLGDPSLFADGLGKPWPPFAFDSGMWVRDVDRATAESIGLIKPGEDAPAPMTIDEALKEAA